MFNLKEIFSPTAKKKGMLSCDEAAKLLATSPEALEACQLLLTMSGAWGARVGGYPTT